MSHRRPMYDTQQGDSRTRDATVPRNAKLPTARHDGHQFNANRPGADARMASRTSPLMIQRTPNPSDRLVQKPVVNSTRNPKRRSISAPKNVIADTAASRATIRPESTSQEVPLVMEYQGAIPSGQTSGMGYAYAHDSAEDFQSALDLDHDAIFGIVMPRGHATARSPELPPRLIPELQALAASSTRLPQASNASTVSSPSTKFSSSPSPWSVSTAATTPISWSSASPAILQPVTGPVKRSQTVPLPVGMRERIPKVPALPAAHTFPIESERLTTTVPNRKKTPLQTPAPTPPPRTSSAKQSLSRSSSKSDRYQPTPSSSDFERSPLARRGHPELGIVGQSLQHGKLTRAHDNLQRSLAHAPLRTSRKTSGAQEPQALAPQVIPAKPLSSASSTRSRRIERSATHSSLPSVQQQQQEVQTRNIVPKVLPRTPEPAAAKVQSSPSQAPKSSRFGLFSRKPKSPAPDTEKSPRKLQRKGPTAGTGHEGYGIHTKRGRKTPEESASVRGSESERSISSTRRIPLFTSRTKESRSTSRNNRSSQSDLDEFASTRLKPVPIVGGSGSLKDNSDRQVDLYSPSVPPGTFRDQQRTPSQPQTSVNQQSLQDPVRLADDRGPEPPRVPNLAIRRSQRFRTEAETFNLPAPIRTEGLSIPLYINSQDDSRSTGFPVSTPSTTTDLNHSDLAIQKPSEKRSRRLRWNIFRRKTPEPEPSQSSAPISVSPEELSVSVSAIPISRSMPYYAMMDSESEVNHPEHIGDYLAEVVHSPSISPLVDDYDADIAEDESQTSVYEDKVFLPSIPQSSPHSFAQFPPRVPLHNPVRQNAVPLEQPSQRQPRLVRVGRIPPVASRNEREHTVASRNEREHKPSRASFSQPFARPLAEDDFHIPSRPPQQSTHVPLHINTNVLPSRPFVDIAPAQPFSAPLLGQSETFGFPSRQVSQVSSSSSSGGVRSILGPALVPRAPESGLPTQAGMRPSAYFSGSPSIDEVWNEYDDFIDHVMSPSGSRRGTKTHWYHNESEVEQPRPETLLVLQESYPRTAESGAVLSGSPVSAMKGPVFAGAPVTSSTPPVVFAPAIAPESNVGEDIRLRRSRIVSALHSPKDLASPYSIRDLISEYQDHPRSSNKFSDRLSTSTAGGSLERLTVTTRAPDVPPETTHQQNVTMLDVVERGKDPGAQNELHYASLMVAKWLSFGRVLFSPAHDEVETWPERHILVIDGLGNEDWSIYCAVNYESQKAFVHNLTERKTAKGAKPFKSTQHSPDNHRRAEVASFQDRFPFPPGFFSAVVLRFPPAMAEAKLKNIIAECRRVLWHGGYLEVMLLDLDIVNMGVQTRRAVRELKFKMTTADKQVSLRPIIDNVQGVLGARGFTNISRCVVGVPVAGRPSGSAESPSSSRSSGGSDGLAKRASGDARAGHASPRMTFGQGHRGANLSLNDLLSDRSDNADLRIGRIVSRTARTWWQHCFEASVLSNGNLAGSIFADKNVLAECKARGSSFKMLIAYAQRPVFEIGRRTMSEPVVSTLARAGPQNKAQSTINNPRTA